MTPTNQKPWLGEKKCDPSKWLDGWPKKQRERGRKEKERGRDRETERDRDKDREEGREWEEEGKEKYIYIYFQTLTDSGFGESFACMKSFKFFFLPWNYILAIYISYLYEIKTTKSFTSVVLELACSLEVRV